MDEFSEGDQSRYLRKEAAGSIATCAFLVSALWVAFSHGGLKSVLTVKFGLFAFIGMFVWAIVFGLFLYGFTSLVFRGFRIALRRNSLGLGVVFLCVNCLPISVTLIGVFLTTKAAWLWLK